jgi:regulator of RNase E activity RraA
MESKHKMDILANTLIQRLMAKGMEGTVLTAYFRNVANILATESPVSLWELNR